MLNGLMDYECSKFLIFIKFYTKMGHYLFFIRIPFYFIYISSFPTIKKRRFHMCNYQIYKSSINYWQRSMKKPNMISFPESKEIRKKLFKEFVKKSNE